MKELETVKRVEHDNQVHREARHIGQTYIEKRGKSKLRNAHLVDQTKSSIDFILDPQGTANPKNSAKYQTQRAQQSCKKVVNKSNYFSSTYRDLGFNQYQPN